MGGRDERENAYSIPVNARPAEKAVLSVAANAKAGLATSLIPRKKARHDATRKIQSTNKMRVHFTELCASSITDESKKMHVFVKINGRQS